MATHYGMIYSSQSMPKVLKTCLSLKVGLLIKLHNLDLSLEIG